VLAKPTSLWDETDLRALIEEAVPESDRLDYKRELTLTDGRARAEVAKDVSSFANTMGGRLIYGLAEDSRAKTGAPVRIVPLADAGLQDRLVDVIYERCTPNVRVQMKSVSVESGYCLIVDVPESVAPVMVSGSGQNRFYKRYQRKSVPMNERDVRERYARLASVREVVADLLESAAPVYGHPSPWWTGNHLGFLTLLVVPAFGPMDLFDPARFRPPELRDLLAAPRKDLWRYMRLGRPAYFGTEYSFDNPDHMLAFLRLHRNGVAEFHYTLDVREEDASFYTILQANVLLDALEALEAIYRKAGYFGDVHVLGEYRHVDGYKIWIQKDTVVPLDSPRPLAHSTITSVETLSQARLEFVTSLLNRVAQAAGVSAIGYALVDGVNTV